MNRKILAGTCALGLVVAPLHTFAADDPPAAQVPAESVRLTIVTASGGG